MRRMMAAIEGANYKHRFFETWRFIGFRYSQLRIRQRGHDDIAC
jgi:hypothetical protein